MQNLNSNLSYALYYQSIGWNPLPVPSGEKRPTIDWKKYQTEKVTVEEIKTWWQQWPDANIAIVTGKISNLIVLDLDAKDERSSKEFQIPITVCAKSGGNGEHFFFKYFGENTAGSAGQLFGSGVDIRAEGNIVIVAPSLHESGNHYEWTLGPDDTEIAETPDWLKEAINNQPKRQLKLWQKGAEGVPEGLRNNTAISIACKIRSCLPIELIETVGWAGLVACNERNNKPLPINELQNVWVSSRKYDSHLENDSEKILIDKPRLWTVGEILKQDFGTAEWLVDPLIPQQGITILSGNPGDFKTWVTIHIALCLSRGVPVFGQFQVEQGGVLIIDEEDHLRFLRKRLELLGAKDTDDIHYLSQCGLKMDSEIARQMIVDIIREKNIKLIVIDSLVRVHQQDENDARGMAKVFSGLQEFIKAGASILLTHHHRKQVFGTGSSNGQSMRGSSDILAAVDCHLIIEKKRDEPDTLVIKQTKLRQDEALNPFEIKILKNSIDDEGQLCLSGFAFAGGHDDRQDKAEEVAEAVIMVLAEGQKSRSEIHKILKDEFGKNSIDDGIKIAETKKTIELVPKKDLQPDDRKKSYYKLPGILSSLVIESSEELPVSYLPRETEKQEVTVVT